MAERSDEKEQDIQVTRQEIGEDLSLLQQKAMQTVDWHRQVATHPWPALGLAVAGGMLLAILTIPLGRRM